MKRKWMILIVMVVVSSLLLSCQLGGISQEEEGANTATPEGGAGLPSPTAAPESDAGLPNPAATFCQDQGYRYEIRTAADGSQSGVCIFADGSECDEWAFFRGECGPAGSTGSPTTVPTASAGGGQPALWLDKTTFVIGEEIQVHFTAPPSYPSGAWVGLLSADVPHGSEDTNDQHDLEYRYLEGQTSGVLTFVAPLVPGSYDFRMHDTDDNGTEVAAVGFSVEASAEQPALWLDKATFVVGEEIQVHFAAPSTYPSGAWVGLLPADVPHGSDDTNDQYDLDYEYLEGRPSGVLTFAAPLTLGAYDFRMHDTDDNGREVASVSFTVVASSVEPALWLDKATFAPGEEIQVHFTAPPTYPSGAWVGLIPSEVPHGSEATNDEYDLDYQYLDGRASDVLTFVAPDAAGSYDFRMHDTDADGREVASVTFQVAP